MIQGGSSFMEAPMWLRHGLPVILVTLASVGFVACSSNTTGLGLTSLDSAASTGGPLGTDGTLGGDGASTGGAMTIDGAASTIEMPGTGGVQSTGGSITTYDAPGAGGARTVDGATGLGGSPGTGGAMTKDGSITAVDAPNGGGYFTSSDWHGYAWTSAYPTGSTINPSDFTANAVGFPFCATGTALGESDYSGGGEIGFNINQAQGTNTPTGTWQPSTLGVGGVIVNISNPGNSPRRVQLVGPNCVGPDGGYNSNDQWCATIGAFDREVLIPWTTFNTACWDNSGTTYAGQPIQSLNIQMPGQTVAATYSFCVNSIASATVTTTLPITCALPSTWGGCATGSISCGPSVCCSSKYTNYCSKTNLCYSTQEEAAAACGSTACSACATPTNICPPSPGIGTCSNAGDLWCGSSACCDSAHPYNCPATNLCYQTATAAAAACGGTACSTCKTTSACTKTCPTGQTLDATTCTCNSTSTGTCTNFCTGGGTPSAYPACQCPTCAVTYCAGGGTPTYPACLCPTCAVTYCAGGGTPTYPACLCPTCAVTYCAGGGTPTYPACLC